MERVAIIGGGPGGLMLARLLQLQGMSPVVFERDAHVGERPQGGSLDLHGETGQHAMKLAGLEEEFASAARFEDQGDRLYDPDGNLLFDRDGEGDDRPEIDRTDLRRILLGSLAPETVRWNSRVSEITPGATGVTVIFGEMHEGFDLVVGADGAWSRVRPLLSDALPAYAGVTLLELGFDASRHSEVASLTGDGKMFAVGHNRALITQKNGSGHIRGYAGLRMPESMAREWSDWSPDLVRDAVLDAFSGWAPALLNVIEQGDFVAVRPMYALPIGHRWSHRRGVTMLGDAAHLMSPFSGEGVNLALADAVDLAEAIAGGQDAIARAEALISDRAEPAATGAKQGLEGAFSEIGVAHVLDHYRERVAE